MKQINLPEDLESPNDKFFQHPIVEWLINNTTTVINSNCFGTKEPAKELYDKLTDATNHIVSKGGRGFFWVVCNPEISDLLSTSPSFVTAYNEQFPIGYPIVIHTGILNKRWRIYSDMLVGKNTLLVGAGFSKKSVNFYCKVQIEEKAASVVPSNPNPNRK